VWNKLSPVQRQCGNFWEVVLGSLVLLNVDDKSSISRTAGLSDSVSHYLLTYNASAVISFTQLYTYDLDLWPRDPENLFTYIVNIGVKFHCKHSGKYSDISSREIIAITDGRLRPEPGCDAVKNIVK